jgi:L-threonylcarbamoyladenylate synthase
MTTLRLDASKPDDIERAASLLREGKLVAIPTETVYGLAARIGDERAIEQIFQVKGRPHDNPLIVHCARIEDIERVATRIPPIAWRLFERFAPGPLTLILERAATVPAIVSAGLPTVAVRVPSPTVTCALIERVGEAVVAPSANRSGRPSPTTAEHVFEDLGGSIAAVLDAGRCSIGIESTVLNVVDTIAIVRPGVVTADDIAEVIGFQPPIVEASVQSQPIAPGMKYRHYAPATPVILIESLDEIPPEMYRDSVVLATKPIGQPWVARLLSHQTLYDEFRRADHEQRRAIYVLLTPDVRDDDALMNRLRKAAASAPATDTLGSNQ